MSLLRIFFDSGMVLVYPRSGEWFFPNAYKEYCRSHGLSETPTGLTDNFRKAYAALCGIKLIADEEEEHRAFGEFYGILFRGLEGMDNEELVGLCTEAKSRDYGEYAFYEDVRPAIERLSRTYSLGIISDAWPSLLGVYRQESMFGYFDPFIISSMHGCTKEGFELFKIALSKVEERPEDCLFVDDSYGNCKRAGEVGMKAVILNRNKYQRDRGDIPALSTMAELEDFISKA